MSTTKSRIDWLDMARGWGMLAVILGHIGTGTLHDWIYTFHMPLFFLLSGYTFRAKGGFAGFLKKKAKTIVLPYLALGLPLLAYTIIEGLISGGFTGRDCLDWVMSYLFQRRAWTIWFLACLFFLQIIFYWAVRLLKTNRALAVFSGLACCAGLVYYRLGGIALPWDLDICLPALPFFFVGYLYRQHHAKVDRWLDSKLLALPLMAGFLIINVACGWLSQRISGSGLEMFQSSYGCWPLTYLSAFAGIGAVIVFSKLFTLHSVRFIGENSMLYLAWHKTLIAPLVVWLLSLPGFTMTGGGTLFVLAYELVETILIAAILAGITVLLRKTPLKVIMGK